MPKSWIGWPLRKDYIAPNFYEIFNTITNDLLLV